MQSRPRRNVFVQKNDSTLTKVNNYLVGKFLMLIRLSFLIAAAFAAVTAAPALAAPIVVPGNLAATEGNSASSASFGQINVSRYQQVYGASQFGAGPVTLTGLSFRTNGVSTGNLFEGVGNAFSTSREMSFALSTTAAVPDALSANFAANIGTDAQFVINRGIIAYSSAARSSNGTTRDFDVTFTFDHAFNYNASKGNLLLEVKDFSGGSVGPNGNGTALDAVLAVGDSVSSLYQTNNADAPSGVLNNRGYVTQFQVTNSGEGPGIINPVPEPAALSLVLMGLGVVGMSRRRRIKNVA